MNEGACGIKGVVKIRNPDTDEESKSSW